MEGSANIIEYAAKKQQEAMTGAENNQDQAPVANGEGTNDGGDPDPQSGGDKDENGYNKNGSLYKTPHGEKTVTVAEWAKHYEGKNWTEIATDNKGADGDGFQRYLWGLIKFRLGPKVEWRYVELDDGRVLDMRHVLVVGMRSEFKGAAGEYLQFFSDKSSFNQTQDFVSNAAGAGFLKYLQQNSIYYKSAVEFGKIHERNISGYFYNYIYGIKP